MDATAKNYTSTATWLHLHALRLEALRTSIDEETEVALNRTWPAAQVDTLAAYLGLVGKGRDSTN